MRAIRGRWTVRRGMIGVLVVALPLGGWAAWHRWERSSPPAEAWVRLAMPRSPFEDESEADRVERFDRWRQTQMALMTSPPVFDAAVVGLRTRRPAVLAGRADPLAWLRRGIRVTEKTDEVVTISMPGEARPDQAAIVNAVVHAYVTMAFSWEQSGQTRVLRDAWRIASEAQLALAAQRRQIREEKPASPEQLAEWSDEVAVLEDTARRLRRVVERRRLASLDPPKIEVIAQAVP